MLSVVGVISLIEKIGSWLFHLESKHTLSGKFLNHRIVQQTQDSIQDLEDQQTQDSIQELASNIALVGDQWSEKDYRNLVHHDGNIIIRHNPGMHNLDFLSSLETVMGNFVLFENMYLENVNGLRNLRHRNKST